MVQGLAPPLDDWVANVRVDDSPEPLPELRRLVGVSEATRRIYAPPAGETVDEAVAAAEAAGLVEPDVTWAALHAAAEGGDGLEAARERLDRLLAGEPRYVELVRRRRKIAEAFGIEPHPEAP